MTELTDEHWSLFEQTFNIDRNDVVNVRNHFRHECKLFVHKDDLDAWNYKQEDWNGRSEIVFNYYEIMFFNENRNHKWIIHN